MIKFGKQVFKLQSVDSTNNFAAKLISEGLADNGAVVLADFQTNGRGQRGNSWESESGLNLMASYILFPDNMALSEGIYLNWWVATALVKVLSNYHVHAKIKWPNDIFVGAKKIGGILIETTNHSAKIESVVLGLGINLNQIVFQNNNATSLKLESGSQIIISEFASMISEELTKSVKYLMATEFLHNLYESNMFLLNEIGEFKKEEATFQAKILGVNESGKLKLGIDSELRTYNHGELTWVLP